MISVSIVIPTFNHAQFLLQAVGSAAAQTFGACEVIVINDGSPDNTSEVVMPLVQAGTIRYCIQVNKGQAAARNAGIAQARGEFIALLDDDDLWPPDKLEWQVRALRADSRCVAVGGIASTIDEEGRTVSDSVPLATGELTKLQLYTGNPFISPGQVLIRTSALRECGGFDAHFAGTDDYDLWFRLRALGTIQAHPRVALKYRIHATNASRHRADMLRNTKRVLSRHLALESPADRRRYARPAYRFLYDYAAVPLITETRSDLRRLRLGSAFKKFSAMRYLAGPLISDPGLLWRFIAAWKPRAGR